MTRKADPTLLAAYAATHYVVNGVERPFVLRVNERSAPLEVLHRRHGVDRSAFLTAWNPRSQRRADAINQAAQSELEATLRASGLKLFSAIGIDPDGNWPGEPSVLALGIAREQAEQIGRQYGQNALLWMGADAVPELVLLTQQTQGGYMSRLSTLDEKNLAPDARAFLDALNSGPRGKLGLIGPFGVWAHAPVVGQAAQAFGAAVRFKTQLPERIKEIAICTVGAHYKAKFEFAAHGPMAIAAGVPAAAVEAIRLGDDPKLVGDDLASYRVARELLQAHRLSDATFADAKARFGEAPMIELVTIIGYYCLISLTLNAFDVELTSRMTDPFP